MAAVLDRRDRRAGRDPPHHRDRDRGARIFLGRAARRLHLAEPALDDGRAETPTRRLRAGDAVGQLDHLQRTGPVRQPADEAALLQRHDQAVDAGFRLQVERVLHLVEGGRHAALAQALMDEAEQFELFACQHGSRRFAGSEESKQITNIVQVRLVFRKGLQRSRMIRQGSPCFAGSANGGRMVSALALASVPSIEESCFWKGVTIQPASE